MPNRLLHELRLLAVALQFLTRWPVTLPGTAAAATWDERWLRDCVRHFPVAGAAVGTAVGLVLGAASLLWPPAIAAVLAVALGAWWTGAFHEDGLADTFDALGGRVPRERALAIMKDSRIGTYGALALGLVTTARVAGLAATVPAPGPPAQTMLSALAACVWTHALARWVSVAVMAELPYAGDEAHAKAKPLARGVPRLQVLAAAGWLLPLSLAVGALAPGGAAVPAATVLAAVLVALGMRRWLRQRLGGYTGDTLGAAEQLAEAAILLAWVAMIGVAR